ncbi:MAG: hypothetical protein QGF36_03055 [Candidatus Marinimicrobia bacterium]|jgi:hypothetical protein|nr:hypothetical protein [Candidatus Neomarinimicrobiota bacterium]MDP6936391.1 hypothetical protein [Candidatus Neomarinimicrobiota bacterium]
MVLTAWARPDYGGGYAGSGLRSGSNAREVSLGGALSADRTQGFSAFSNPALMSSLPSSQFGVSYQALSLDRYVSNVHIGLKLPPKAGMGIGFRQLGTENIQGRDAMNMKTEIYSAKETEGILSFGVAPTRKVSIGINIRVMFPALADDYTGKGITQDIGILYKHNNRLYLAAVAKNLSGNYTWKYKVSEDEHSVVETIPKEFILSGAMYLRNGLSIFLQEDILHLGNNPLNYRLRFGMEYGFRNGFKCRLGGRQAESSRPIGMVSENKIIKPAFGFGMPIRISGGNYIHFDYAFLPGAVGEGGSNIFSLSLK